MADNYLEKRMEDYRRGLVNSGPRRVLTPSGSKPLTYTARITTSRVLVVVSDASVAAEIAAAFASVGCATTFLTTDIRSAQPLAQRIGAQAWPVNAFTDEETAKATTAVAHRREGLDLIITDLPDYALRAHESASRVILLTAEGLITPDAEPLLIVSGYVPAKAAEAAKLLLALATLPTFPRQLTF